MSSLVDHPADGLDALLTLHHAAELREVGLEPVLFTVLLRGLAQVHDHLIHALAELQDLALRLDRDASRGIALGDRRGDLGHRADLVGEAVGELIDVVDQIAPRSGGAGHLGLASELSFGADLACHTRDLARKGAERVGHRVERVGERGDLALRVGHELLRDRRPRRR